MSLQKTTTKKREVFILTPKAWHSLIPMLPFWPHFLFFIYPISHSALCTLTFWLCPSIPDIPCLRTFNHVPSTHSDFSFDIPSSFSFFSKAPFSETFLAHSEFVTLHISLTCLIFLCSLLSIVYFPCLDCLYLGSR